jgi:hypothetical protein
MLRADQQKHLLDQEFNPIEVFRAGIRRAKPWDSIIDFATHRSYCGKRLYPRQRTLLKLIKLEVENFSDYDHAVIEEWTRGFQQRQPEGVQPDVMDRIAHLKARGYNHFPHVEAILGRRGSKGITGGVLGAERMAYMFSLGDWQAHYDVDPGADGYLTVVATNMTQAMRFQFNDIRRTVEKCRYLQPHISTSKDGFLSIRTAADRARLAEMKIAKIPIEREIATLRAIAMSSNSASGRGGASYAMYYDEFAHMIQGTGGKQSSEEVYAAYQPSLDQFHEDSFTFVPSSPYCCAPETRVLTEDLRWVPVGDLELGDKLVGFDEHDGGKGVGRTWQPAEVTHTEVIEVPRYKVTTESGKQIVCTSEHLWLTKAAPGIGRGNGRGSGRPPGISQRFVWAKTTDLVPGDNIKSLGVDPWDEDNTRDAGYLAGFFDGEGHFSKTGLGMTQNHGLVLDKVSALLKERGFDMSDYAPDAPLAKTRVRGGWPEVLRLLGTVRPERLLDKFTDRFYGGRIYGNAKTGDSVDPVVSVERVEDGPVVALSTSTHTLIAEGLLSHNTQVGQFYDLYLQGTALMKVYNERHGMYDIHEVTGEELGVDDAEEALSTYSANPEMLVIQLPSWALYKDWEISHTMDVQNRPLRTGVKPGPTFRGAIQLPPEESDRMRLLEMTNPEKFKVERRAQFASVIDAYLDPQRVDQMFLPPFVTRRDDDNKIIRRSWQGPVQPQDYGRFDRTYIAHADPGRTNANFAFAIAHVEDAPPDEHGEIWPHVIFDYLRVWKPVDFDEHTIDYVVVGEELHDILNRFRSTEKLSFDQWNSAGFIAQLRQAYSPAIRIVEEPFSEKVNIKRCEMFKSAINLGWVHCYKDNFYKGGEGSLLEMELKFLTEKNGKVVKQDFGPVTTKDLADCVMTVTTTLLHASLDRYLVGKGGQMAFGSSDVQRLRSGEPVGAGAGVRAGANKRALESIRSSAKQRSRQAGSGMARNRGRLR